jgi:hypothetical protein
MENEGSVCGVADGLGERLQRVGELYGWRGWAVSSMAERDVWLPVDRAGWLDHGWTGQDGCRGCMAVWLPCRIAAFAVAAVTS